MQDTETQEQKHVRIARHFLDAADKLFDEGDYVQTSEKLWGATSHALKLLCIRRRWRHGKYAHFGRRCNGWLKKPETIHW